MELWRDKKGSDDVGGVWGEVGVCWDFVGTQITQMLRNADFRRFFNNENRNKNADSNRKKSA
jgi:hypothetical protein